MVNTYYISHNTPAFSHNVTINVWFQTSASQIIIPSQAKETWFMNLISYTLIMYDVCMLKRKSQVTHGRSVLIKVLRDLARLVSTALPPKPTTRAVNKALFPPVNDNWYRYIHSKLSWKDCLKFLTNTFNTRILCARGAIDSLFRFSADSKF